MSKTKSLLKQVRLALAPPDSVLSHARTRRAAVLGAVTPLIGHLSSFYSGSIAHGTANRDADADAGVVIDRRVRPEFGPEGDGLGPAQIVSEARQLIQDDLLDDWAGLSVTETKRALLVTFDEVIDGEDPSVDLILALTRREGPGLWIPNLSSGTWDPSDPEEHTRLLNALPLSLRVTRARAIRLAKGWNGQFDPVGMCSFNIEAIALDSVEGGMSEPEALLAIFEGGAEQLASHATPDPAGVSDPIRLPIARIEVVERLQTAGLHLSKAIDNDDDTELVQEQLAQVFPNYVNAPTSSSLAAALTSKTGPSLVVAQGFPEKAYSARAYGTP